MPPAAPLSSEARRKRILIADDNAYYLTIIGDALTEAGYEIAALSDGFVALETIEREHERLDLVVLNRELPGLSGMEIVQKARERIPVKRLLLLIMDVFSKKGEEIEALKSSGASGYFNKSIPIEEIVYRINDLLFPPTRFSRKNPRAVIYLPVEFTYGGEKQQSYSFTVSADGMYIQSMSPPPPRSELTLCFRLADGREVTVPARVIYRYRYDPHRTRSVLPGMAVVFESIDAETKAAINKFVVDTLVHSARAQKEAVGSAAQPSMSEQIATCGSCIGLGKVPYVVCNACSASGKDCPVCRGTGLNPFIRKVCPECHGVGSVRPA